MNGCHTEALMSGSGIPPDGLYFAWDVMDQDGNR